MVKLTSENFNELVINSDDLWFVEFYGKYFAYDDLWFLKHLGVGIVNL